MYRGYHRPSGLIIERYSWAWLRRLVRRKRNRHGDRRYGKSGDRRCPLISGLSDDVLDHEHDREQDQDYSRGALRTLFVALAQPRAEFQSDEGENGGADRNRDQQWNERNRNSGQRETHAQGVQAD